MKLLIAMDDTDNLETRGTGHLADDFRKLIEEKGWGTTGLISRHQLLVDPRIPYTSHNSAMCFPAEIGEEFYDLLIEEGGRFLERESAPGSDPGFAVAQPDRIGRVGEIVEYGKMARMTVLTKDQAYTLAARIGMHLSEHGGTGGGVIGALAGIGLRLSGNDGRMRGGLEGFEPGETYRVDELLGNPRIDSVIAADPRELPLEKTPESLDHYLESSPLEIAGSDLVLLRDKVKCIHRFHRSVLLLCHEEGQWTNWHREDLKVF